MKIYKNVLEPHEVLDYIVCDKCKEKFNGDNTIELQEFLHINFVGGYGSVFGDGYRVECDICQHCLHDMIYDIYKRNYM